MASSRTAYALITVLALLWVYVLTVLVYCVARPIFPEKGKPWVLILLASSFGAIYLLVFSLISPFLAMETAFVIALTPVSCIGSELCKRVESLDLKDALLKALTEALSLGGLIFALALIREPLGFGSLSVPGGAGGIIELFGGDGDGLYYPIRIFAASAGAFLILGYGLALFRSVKGRYTRQEER
jgi:Na+-translocating ferredoxin:NAD+ oxidoreductase RnfE subunit